jgi:hypothetical protein
MVAAPPNVLELGCPAEEGNLSPLYAWPAGKTSILPGSPARRDSFSELLGRQLNSDDDGKQVAMSNRGMTAPSS